MIKKIFSMLVCATILCSTTHVQAGGLKAALFGAGAVVSLPIAGLLGAAAYVAGSIASEANVDNNSSAAAAGVMLLIKLLAAGGAAATGSGAAVAGTACVYCAYRSIDELKKTFSKDTKDSRESLAH